MLDSLRRLMRDLVALFLYYSGFVGVVYFFRRVILHRREVCILGFHRVLNETEFATADSLPGMRIRERTFGDLLEFLKKRFEVKPLNIILKGEEWGSSWRKPTCILTFDDGWLDNYTTAYPWLEKYDVPATIFLTTGYIDGQYYPWVEEFVASWKDVQSRDRVKSLISGRVQGRFQQVGLQETVQYLKAMRAEEREAIMKQLNFEAGDADRRLGSNGMMRWRQIAEMCNGRIEFGAHTVSHPLLTYESDETVEHELRKAKEEIESQVKKPAWAFAYPNGDRDSRIRQWAQRTGYACAVTTQRGWHRRGADPYDIRRILIHEGNVTGTNGKFSEAAFHFTIAPWR